MVLNGVPVLPGLRFCVHGFYFGLQSFAAVLAAVLILILILILVLVLVLVLVAGLSPVSPSFLPSFFPPFRLSAVPPFPPFPCPRSSFPFTFSCVQFFFPLFMPPTALPSSQYLFFPPFPFFSLFPVMNPSFLVLFPLFVLITPCFLPHAFPCPYIAHACARTPILFRSCSGLLSPVRPLRCSCRGPFLRRCGRN